MPARLQYELCPETGIGCLMVETESDAFKIDLMPDEAENLHSLVHSGDMDAAMALLTSIDSRDQAALGELDAEALALHIV
ncbi:MAG: hypothetical protein HYX78_07160 [Armatimonadetes bacterium]|nr:hypothetical protein [Armatimonadota bacterium]